MRSWLLELLVKALEESDGIGPADYADEGLGGTVRRTFSVVTNFFTRTRWDRLFHQIH